MSLKQDLINLGLEEKTATQLVEADYSELETKMINTIKYKLADHMRNSMHIPDDFHQYLDVYKLQYWEVPTFKNSLVDGQIEVDGLINFNVIYYNCTPAAAKAAKEIKLSYRLAKPEFNIEPYVLVQIVEQ